jgi:hypothetical protein
MRTRMIPTSMRRFVAGLTALGKNEREGKVHLRPVQTIAAGIAFGRP